MSSSPRALVVDDQLVVRKATSMALEKEGFNCETACDGYEAFKKAQHGRFDVVITDLCMPNGHGHALAVDLLQMENRPVVIIQTGVIEPKLAKDLVARGVDDIVFKPVSPRALAAKVQALVAKREKSQQAAKADGTAET